MKLIFMFNTKSIVFGVCSIVLRHSFTLQIYQKKSLFLHALNVDAVLAFLSLCKFIKTRGLGCTTCQWPFFRFKKRCLGYFKSEWGMAKAFSVVGFGLSLTRYVCSKILFAQNENIIQLTWKTIKVKTKNSASFPIINPTQSKIFNANLIQIHKINQF